MHCYVRVSYTYTNSAPNINNAATIGEGKTEIVFGVNETCNQITIGYANFVFFFLFNTNRICNQISVTFTVRGEALALK